MIPYYLLIIAFNLNGQYKTNILTTATAQECVEMRSTISALKVPKHAKYHHIVGFCLRGESAQEWNDSIDSLKELK